MSNSGTKGLKYIISVGYTASGAV